MTPFPLSTGQKGTLAVLSGPGLSILLAASGISSAVVTLPDISAAFGGQSADPTRIVLICILAVTALIVPVGRAGDLYGKRGVLVSGLCLFPLGAGRVSTVFWALASCATGLADRAQRVSAAILRGRVPVRGLPQVRPVRPSAHVTAFPVRVRQGRLAARTKPPFNRAA